MDDCGQTTTIDLRGLKCPLPALRTRKALSRLDPGALIVVECTDPLAEIDIPNLIRETGDDLLDSARRRARTRDPSHPGIPATSSILMNCLIRLNWT